MHAVGERLGNDFPTRGAPLRRFELARVAQVQARTSFFRFVREHLMRHAERRRENFPVESGFSPHAPPRLLLGASGAAAHVLRCEFFGRQHRALLHHARRLLVPEVTVQVADALMQPGQAEAQPLVPNGTPALAFAQVPGGKAKTARLTPPARTASPA